jgi:FMN-dependent NADH-azoreductase
MPSPCCVCRIHPPPRVITRDLGGKPILHLTVESVTVLRGVEPANAEQAAARALSDELIAEFKAADTLVIGALMYNFGIASTLKTWFDHVLRVRITLKYSERGPVGLLEGKRAIVVESRGGLCGEGAGKGDGLAGATSSKPTKLHGHHKCHVYRHAHSSQV